MCSLLIILHLVRHKVIYNIYIYIYLKVDNNWHFMIFNILSLVRYKTTRLGYQDSQRSVKICETSHWAPHSFGLVLHRSKELCKLLKICETCLLTTDLIQDVFYRVIHFYYNSTVIEPKGTKSGADKNCPKKLMKIQKKKICLSVIFKECFLRAILDTLFLIISILFHLFITLPSFFFLSIGAGTITKF